MAGIVDNQTATTKFLNVDLEVLSRRPLEGLVEAFGKKVDVLHVGKWGRRYGAYVEVSGSGYRGNAERLIRRFLAMIVALPQSKRRLWTTRNQGISTSGLKPPVRRELSSCDLRRETLEAIASVNGRLVASLCTRASAHSNRGFEADDEAAAPCRDGAGAGPLHAVSHREADRLLGE